VPAGWRAHTSFQVGKIIQRFEEKGFRLVALKLKQADKELLSEHYGDLSKKPFFPGLVSYMASGPVVAMVSEHVLPLFSPPCSALLHTPKL
jgi:nucleoside diphosphate kinase